MRWLTATGLPFIMLLVSCGGKPNVEGTPLSGVPETGALYSLNDGEGGFRAGKVVATEENAIFIQLYEKRWKDRPTREQAKTAAKPIPLGYSTESFASMQPYLLQGGTVSEEELAAYQNWRRSNRAVF